MLIEINLKSIPLFLFFPIILFSALIYADTNGIWHKSEDIKNGTFALDEQANTIDFTFINPVFFYGNEIIVKGNFTFNGDRRDKLPEPLHNKGCTDYKGISGFDGNGDPICSQIVLCSTYGGC